MKPDALGLGAMNGRQKWINLLYAWSNAWRVFPDVRARRDDAHNIVDGRRGGFL